MEDMSWRFPGFGYRGWRPPTPDPRDYLASRYIRPSWQITQPVLWTVTAVLNQKETNHCVGFCGADFLNTYPVADGYTGEDAHKLYYACKLWDREPGNEDGSTIHALAKELKVRGRIDGHAWARSLDDILLWLTNKGPVAVGTYWTRDMFFPDQYGQIGPTGELVGGHAYLAIGYDPSERLVTFLNSWGTEWGITGTCTMRDDEWWGLLQQDGEAMMSIEKPLTGWTPEPVTAGCWPLRGIWRT